ELLVALDADVTHVRLGPGCLGPALTQESDQRPDDLRRALRVHLDGSVVGRAHPSEDTELACALADHRADVIAAAGTGDDRPNCLRGRRRGPGLARHGDVMLGRVRTWYRPGFADVALRCASRSIGQPATATDQGDVSLA